MIEIASAAIAALTKDADLAVFLVAVEFTTPSTARVVKYPKGTTPDLTPSKTVVQTPEKVPVKRTVKGGVATLSSPELQARISLAAWAVSSAIEPFLSNDENDSIQTC